MRTIEVVLYREKMVWVAQALNVDVSSFSDTREEAERPFKRLCRSTLKTLRMRRLLKSLR